MRLFLRLRGDCRCAQEVLQNTLFISVLTGLQLSECDWTIFYLSEQACGDETALVDVPARRDVNRHGIRTPFSG
jgi:hypothetical protein